MGWLQTVTFPTAALAISTQGTSLGAVLNNLTHDIQFWGGNVDAGGNFLVNCAGILPPGATAFLGLWSSSTTYAANVVVVDSSGLGYLSLAGTNLNHTPSTSPTWWRPLAISIFGSADQYFTATAGQTTFTPTATPAPFCMVFLNGQKQRPGSSFDYQITAGNVVFTSGLMAGDLVEVIQ